MKVRRIWIISVFSSKDATEHFIMQAGSETWIYIYNVMLSQLDFAFKSVINVEIFS